MRRRIFLTPLMGTIPAINPADLCTAPFIPSTVVICGGLAGTPPRSSLLWKEQAAVLNPIVRLGDRREDINSVLDEILSSRMPERIPGLPGIDFVHADNLRTAAARELIRPLITNNRRKE